MNQKEEVTKKKVFSSVIWVLLEKFTAQGLQFILSVFLARILLPQDYGVVALITVFIQIANVFIIDGFNCALIQKKDSDDLDFSSVFYLTSFISLILFVSMFFCAPYISDFYNQPVLTLMTRIFAFSFFYTPLASCQYAYIEKNLMFKIYFLRSVICILISGIAAVVFAMNVDSENRVWALVVQQLVSGVMNSVILWFSIPWRPKLMFSFNRVKGLFSYGWKFVFSGILDNIFKNINNLVIGKQYDAKSLGIYNRGFQFSAIIANNFTPALKNVAFPSISSKNDEIEAVKNITRRFAQLNAYILFPFLAGLAAVAKPLVLFLLTEKWIDCVPYLQLSCAYFIFYYMNQTNMTAINALGHSGVYLCYEIIKKVITVGILIVSLQYGILAIAVGQLIAGFISSILNIYPSFKILKYKVSEQIKDLLLPFILSVFMGISIWFVTLFPIPEIFVLIIQVAAGILIYLILSILFKLESFTYLLDLLKKKGNNVDAEIVGEHSEN